MSLTVHKGLKLATASRARVAAVAGSGAGALGYTSATLRQAMPSNSGPGSGLLVVGGLVLAGYYYLEEVA